jgi:hypothetical protein
MEKPISLQEFADLLDHAMEPDWEEFARYKPIGQNTENPATFYLGITPKIKPCQVSFPCYNQIMSSIFVCFRINHLNPDRKAQKTLVSVTSNDTCCGRNTQINLDKSPKNPFKRR